MIFPADAPQVIPRCRNIDHRTGQSGQHITVDFLLFHPFDGFWDLSREKRGSLGAANFIVFLMPHVRLLSGFDPMLLGYRKEDNPILPPEHLRGVFNLTGIVHPTVLADGRIVARMCAVTRSSKSAVKRAVFPAAPSAV